MRIWFAFVAGIPLLVACGGESSTTPDAPPAPAIDATPVVDADTCALEQCGALCVDTTRDPAHCGECDHACTAAAICEASTCECPAPFIANGAVSLGSQMVATVPGYVSGALAVTGTDGQNHAVFVTVAEDAPLAQALDAAGPGAYVALGYDLLTPTETRSTYLATGGTVRLSRRCAAGVAGTVANLTLIEVDPDSLQPIAGGCTTTLAALAFDIAGACP